MNFPNTTETTRLDRIAHLQREAKRKCREEQRKADNHWAFIAGRLVAQYLRADLDIPVFKGQCAAQKNREAFAPLENILAYLAAHKDFTAQIAAGTLDLPPDNSLDS